MKLLEALKHKGRPFEIPDAVRDDLPGFFKEVGFQVGAEIGVYKGEFTEKFAKEGLKIYGIDPWLAYKNYNEFDNQGLGRFQKRQDFLYEHSKRVLAPYGDKAVLVRKTSMEAVEDFADNSLDFVYIDGHHGFRYVAEDLCEWSQKVRPGGVIAGHDYALNKKGARDPYVLQVKFVLHAFVDAFGVKNWYVIGSKSPEGERRPAGSTGAYGGYDIYGNGERRDRWRSWFWVKE
jgi:hypothetical protein